MRTRFAPSPTGPLHLGHAYSAMLNADMAQAAQGQFLLRIEDIDRSRSRPEWEAAIFDDLRWLGLDWPEPVMRQSERMPAYAAALDDLWARGLLYVCSSRRDIAEALSAPQEGAPTYGPDGLVYPGTCRPATAELPPKGSRPAGVALRLDLARALDRLERDTVGYTETAVSGQSERREMPAHAMLSGIGDIVLSRRGMDTSYHLAVVLDDARQEITDVARGEDLADATYIHVLLQSLMGLASPVYHHHRLIRDEFGKRLAKRDDARALSVYRAQGLGPEDIRRMVSLPPRG